ncbi:arginyl-tRNA synthetase class Ic [Clostridium sp. CAG:242]|nr:arginyl-tRNA synthetase class Ic [Clostridium sp. CAG:242]
MLHQVKQTSWGGNQNLWILAKLLFLAFHRLTTVDNDRFDLGQKAGQIADIIADLGSKLAGRGKNDCLDLWQIRVNVLNHRDSKSTGFSGSGRSFGNQIFSGKHDRNCFLLNLGHLCKAQFFGGFDDSLRDREGCKGIFHKGHAPKYEIVLVSFM